MILILDNYDSFTYNLVHLVAAETSDYLVVRNDSLSVSDVLAMTPTGVLLSPGPGRPEDAGITESLIHQMGAVVPMLGVCLGLQAIGRVFGGSLTRATIPVHGKTSEVHHDGRSIFRNVDQCFLATRYHSLVVERSTLPNVLEVSAELTDGTIMGLRHRELPIEGVQFHPDSILTTQGPRIVANWMHSLHPESAR